MDARKKALAQGVASGDIDVSSSEKSNEVTTSSMGSGIKNPQKGYGRKKRIKKVAEDLTEDEAMLAILLEAIAVKYGKFDEDGSGIWAGYESAEENEDKEIGVKCSNCVLYAGDGVCKIIAGIVEPEGKCRFAVIPDGVVEMDDQEDDEDIDELIENLFDSYLVNKNFIEEKKMIIQLPYDNVQMVKKKHDSMKAWHEDMAKSHEIAASWHAEQSEELGKAMKEVPLDPEEIGAKTYPAKGQSTDGPDPAAPVATNVPIDPVRKADLVQIIQDHVAEFGDFKLSPEQIVDKIIGD